MNDLKLEELLQSADVAIPSLKLRSGIADQVRRRARARSARKGVGAIAVLIVALAVAIEHRGSNSTAQEVARLRAECVRLDAEARMHERLAEQLLEPMPRPTRPAIDVLVELNAQRSYAAAVLVARGEQLQANQETRSLAMEKYRRVIELFPETDQAAVAAKHLKEVRT